MGGRGAVPQQPPAAVAWLLPDARDGCASLRRRRVLPARPRRSVQLPEPPAQHTVGRQAEPVRDT
ncbi:hypothetical protein MUK42_05977 [Musa troglodytarum]|uniref:Uncharacterized protein n=1 Tax=Musa troglodytarum TaxID=320322 RepID=A0A9E7HL94_9LILI|nr:hypothetical protein MUK42_05977 [Musa troglodytarum]